MIDDKIYNRIRYFVDMGAERSILTEFVYPEIQEYCSERKLYFEIIDLRSNLTEELALKYISNDILSCEIEKCKRLSIGPYFFVSINDYYQFLSCHFICCTR